MALFFTYQTELPDGVGYELFHFQHFVILAACLIVVTAGWLLYRSRREKGQKRRFRQILANSLILLILIRLLYVFLCGAGLLYELPLHLCSIAGMLCFLYEMMGMKMPVFIRSLTEQTMFSLCLPGAVLALLFSDGTMYPVFHFITIQSSLFHTLIILYIMLLLSDGVIVPSVREAWKAVLFLAVLVPVIMAFDVHFRTNYMFLLLPTEGSPLTYPYVRYGYAGYLLCYALAALAEIYLINFIFEKHTG